MSFTGNFPTEAPDATAIASDASGKGPFSVGIACDGGGSLNLKIDNSTNHKIDCDGSKNKIDGIQKVALAGGVKLKISSDKQDGAWKIQLIGAKP
ncbi:hypothetical protein [Curtobacterium sp. S6]|uniref:hypothetical protein n=1 Tax=Curtobacterium sp. S6 TaxID=1479623 RepID=UPI00128EE356|nr:hypothetical protein [Curtobacterium sp. S6]